jgi:hypothetical protein
MAETAVQPSFNGGEWAPNLYSRVDIQKYRSAAALLENFFVDYRGGASTRIGTSYVIQAYDSANPVRIINFQASFNAGYAIEIGNGYMRFIYHGAPITETPKNITGASAANPCVLTIPGSGFSPGDWIFVSGIVGMTQLNNRYFRVVAVAGPLVTIGYLNTGSIDSTGYSTYTSGGTAARIYKIASPYTNADNFDLIKFAQSTNEMVICHPNHPVYILTLIAADNWTLVEANFGPTISPPGTPTVSSTLGVGDTNYAYGVTAISITGEESSMSDPGVLASTLDIRAFAGTNTISWAPVENAIAYNVYEASVVYSGTTPPGSQYGFIGTCQGLTFIDSNIAQDFTLTPPLNKTPFVGNSVSSVTVNVGGNFVNFPTVTIAEPSTTPAILAPSLGLNNITKNNAGSGYAVNDQITLSGGIVVKVTGVSGGAITTFSVVSSPTKTSGPLPATPETQVSTTGGGTGATFDVSWTVTSIAVTTGGLGYPDPVTVVFTPTGSTAAATAHLTLTSINPDCSGVCPAAAVPCGPDEWTGDVLYVPTGELLQLQHQPSANCQ